MSEISLIHAKRSGEKKDSLPSQKKTNSNHITNSPADHILYLQRTIGNQAVQRLIKSGALQAQPGCAEVDQVGGLAGQAQDRAAGG